MSNIETSPNTMPRINSIYAYLSVDKDGNEGVCAAPMGVGGMFVPLIAADKARLVSLTPMAEYIAANTDMKIVLVEFTTRIEHREITGQSES